jgi:hypothetical protein
VPPGRTVVAIVDRAPAAHWQPAASLYEPDARAPVATVSRWRSASEIDLAECATWISFGSRWWSTLTIRSRLVDGRAEALGWVVVGEAADEFEIRPTPDRVPGMLFVPVPEEKAGKNRLHLDFRPVDQTAEVERLLSLGARRADVGQGDASWVVLADPEGNEFCILGARVSPDS